MQNVNLVVMDKMIEDMLLDMEINDGSDIFEIINEHLNNMYSLEDLINYIQDKDSLKKKFAKAFEAQKYARTYDGKIINNERLEDLF